VQSTTHAPLRQVEAITAAWRDTIAQKHRVKAHKARERGRELSELAAQCYRDLLGAPPDGVGIGMPEDLPLMIRSTETTDAWHGARANGQIYRFRNLGRCGYRWRQGACKKCSHERAQVPESCGIRRLCLHCSKMNAKKRRARYGLARARVVLEGRRCGLMRDGDPERYGEKFLTLTNKHWTRTEVEAHVRVLEERAASTDFRGLDREARLEVSRWRRAQEFLAQRGKDLLLRTIETGDVGLRIEMLWRAWPRFRKKLARHLKERRHPDLTLHRAAEWTPGHDGQGHPHFHLWLFAPFIEKSLLAALWTEALREVGAPFEAWETAIVDIRAIKTPPMNLARELLKGDHRHGVRFASLEASDGRPLSGGEAVFVYADGWTIQELFDRCDPDVIAEVYMAFEAKRFTQASAGFFLEVPPPRCENCSSSSETPGGGFRTWFTPRHDHHEPEERGPP